MPEPSFIYQNSRFFESLLERRFLHDLQRSLVLRPRPELLNVLKSDVDAYGFDMVLAVGARSIHVQMKTRSGRPPSSKYDLADSLWSLPNGCAIWMRYDPVTIEPVNYYLLGLDMPSIDTFETNPKKSGYRKVKMQQANHPAITLPELAKILFPTA